MNKSDRFVVYCMYCTIIRLIVIIAVAIQRYMKDGALYMELAKFQTDERSMSEKFEDWTK